jgi:hypothetical protein
MGVKNRCTKSRQRLFKKRGDSRRRFDDSESRGTNHLGSSFLEVSWLPVKKRWQHWPTLSHEASFQSMREIISGRDEASIVPSPAESHCKRKIEIFDRDQSATQPGACNREPANLCETRIKRKIGRQVRTKISHQLILRSSPSATRS